MCILFDWLFVNTIVILEISALKVLVVFDPSVTSFWVFVSLVQNISVAARKFAEAKMRKFKKERLEKQRIADSKSYKEKIKKQEEALILKKNAANIERRLTAARQEEARQLEIKRNARILSL